MSTNKKAIISYVAVGVGAAAAAAAIYYIYSKKMTKRNADEAAAEIRANREKAIEQLINDNLTPLHEQQKSLEKKIAEIDQSIKDGKDDDVDFLRRQLADRKRYEEQLLAVNVTIDSIKNTEATHLRIAHAFAMQQAQSVIESVDYDFGNNQTNDDDDDDDDDISCATDENTDEKTIELMK